MQEYNKDETLEALQEIRNIMDRSARFISLSGWSGIWAGCTALAGAAVAYSWLHNPAFGDFGRHNDVSLGYFDGLTMRFIYLAATIFVVAFAGGFLFYLSQSTSPGTKIMEQRIPDDVDLSLFSVICRGCFLHDIHLLWLRLFRMPCLPHFLWPCSDQRQPTHTF